METKKFVSIVLFALCVILSCASICLSIAELLSVTSLKLIENPHDIHYTDVTVQFGWLSLIAFFGIVSSYLEIKFNGTVWTTVSGYVFIAAFTISPAILLLCF